MPSAVVADPELVRCPRHARPGIPHLHLRAAAHAADLKVDVAHGPDSIPTAHLPSRARSRLRSTPMIPGVILAAGLSTRMGRSKATLPLTGTAPRHVSRPHRQDVSRGRSGGRCRRARAPGRGCGRAGAPKRPGRAVGAQSRTTSPDSCRRCWPVLTAVDRPGVRAMLMTLVDVPLVTASTVRAVLDRFEATGAPIVRPVQGSRHGHPVAIGRALFIAIQARRSSAGREAYRARARLGGWRRRSGR